MKKILLVGNTAWSMYNFRAGLVRALQQDGFEVHVAAPADPFQEDLTRIGCIFHQLYIDNAGTSLKNDLKTIRALLHLLKSLQPAAVVNYTIKPVIYGALAARKTNTPFFSVITGLGSPFTSRRLTTHIIEFLCRITQPHAVAVFFLNLDDLHELVERKVIPKNRARLLPSEGVDLSRFTIKPVQPGAKLNFLYAGRLLWEKGVGTFVEAARIVRAQNPLPVFQLLGPCGALNSSAITADQVQAWQREGIIEYLGNTKDVRPFIEASAAVVLPSFYREGVPRILLEAAAMGRPVLTTNMPGCRDVVDDGVTGLLCRPKSAEDLADKILRIAAMTDEERQTMGQRGRAKAEAEFDERHVVSIYGEAIRKATASSPS